MNKFLRPTISKIIITLIIPLVLLGGSIIYSITFTITENGPPQQFNLLLNIINMMEKITYYPVRFILSPFNNLPVTPTDSITNPYILFPLITFLVLVILESYLIACIISVFTNKK